MCFNKSFPVPENVENANDDEILFLFRFPPPPPPPPRIGLLAQLYLDRLSDAYEFDEYAQMLLEECIDVLTDTHPGAEDDGLLVLLEAIVDEEESKMGLDPQNVYFLRHRILAMRMINNVMICENFLFLFND
jgi:hypothetical protein